LGPIGAGKTTTISMVLGLLKPTSGEIRLFNHKPDEKKVREKIGTMLQEVSVMPGLKVREILELIRSYYPQPLELKDLVNLTGLTEQDLRTRAEKLSGGQKRRLSFALALAGNPELIIFDEPTVGMDITSRNRFWETVRTLANQGKTIIFSTHYLQEADDAADRILLFKDGTIVADGTPEQIKARIAKQSVSFIVAPEISLESLFLHSEVVDIYRKNNRVYVQSNNTDRVLELIFQEKLGAHDIQIEKGKLEEAFEQLTSGTKEAM
ncbi:ABC transporter ATP-binding protein, partial [Bacillus sp. JJ1764]|uniref:ABC transporter ATP-binding protein n=1 Tax=Bacillus sp. JJ1764 TaxID=3122964 RepID=UPI002FFF4AB0